MLKIDDIKDDLAETILKMDVLADPTNPSIRSVLLNGVPSGTVLRVLASPRADIFSIVKGVEGLGRLANGTRPLIRIAQNALGFAQGDTDLTAHIKNIISDLTDYYGGDIRPTPNPLPPGEHEALVFGLQRDFRLPHAFVIGALTTARSIARLQVPRVFGGSQRGNEGVWGTGWLIAPGMLITNWHVVDARDLTPLPQGLGDEAHASAEDLEQQVEQMSVWFDYFLENGPHLECIGGQVIAEDPDLDFALIKLSDESKIGDRHPLRLVQSAPRLSPGSRMNIIQCGDGGPIEFAIRNNFYVRSGATEDFIRYQTDTTRGSSGSPVCSDSWEVLGLHHSSVSLLDMTAVDYGAISVPQEVVEGKPVKVAVLNEASLIHSILAKLPTKIKDEVLNAQSPKVG